MRTSLLPAFLALLALPAPLAALGCGVGSSQSGTLPVRDGGPARDSGQIVIDDAGCSSVGPGPECTDCNDNPVAPLCVGGELQCPTYGCPVQGCDGPLPSCTPDCNGNPVPAYCENGNWTCPTYHCAGCDNSQPITCPASPGGDCVPVWVPECNGNEWTCVEEVPICDVDASFDDASSFDASTDDASDAPSPPPPFACGNLGCDPTTMYCQITTGGPVLEDGGSGGYFYCPPLPSSCPPGGAATCACVQAEQGIGCGCVEFDGDVTITCDIP